MVSKGVEVSKRDIRVNDLFTKPDKRCEKCFERVMGFYEKQLFQFSIFIKKKYRIAQGSGCYLNNAMLPRSHYFAK